MKKKLCSVLCIICASIVVLSGCGNKAVNEAAATSQDTAEVSVKTDGPVSPEGTFPIVEESVELTVMVPGNPNVMDITTNDFTKWWEEQTNVKINWVVAPLESLADKVNISLSSGDMPDIYLNCNITQTQQQVYGTQGAFLPLNDYIAQYGAVYQDIASKVPGLNDVMTMSDGNIYALPFIEKCVHCEDSSKMWVNKKWLDNLGLEVPATVEEFEAMLVAFKEKDPNGNGIADEIPMLTFDGGWHSDPLSGWLTNPFVYTAPDNNFVYLEDGTVEFSYMQDGWKNAMKWLNSLYEQGLYYDQSLIIKMDQARQVAASGDSGSLVGCFPCGTPNTVPGDDASLWSDYVALSPIEGEGGRVSTWMPYNQINPTAFVITAACENPEAAFRWGVELYNRDLCFRKSFGEEGVSWEKIVPGEGDIPADAVDLNSGTASEVSVFIDGVNWNDEQNYCWRAIGLRCDTPDAPEYRYGQYQTGDYDTNMEYRLGFDTRDYMQAYHPDMSVCLPPLVYDEAQATELANSESVVLSYVREMAASFITGALDVDAQWDAYLKELEVKGAGNMKSIYQAAYDAKYK